MSQRAMHSAVATIRAITQDTEAIAATVGMEL